MKRTVCVVRACMAVLCCGVLVLSACGLDTSHSLSSSSSGGHSVDATTLDPTQIYFSFQTSETGNDQSGSFTFNGTEVYYKIYTDASTMRGRRAVIDNLAPREAYTKLTSEYGYQKLLLKEGPEPSPLIQSANRNRYVYIRLNDYNTENSSDYRNVIQVGNSAMMKYDSTLMLGSPRRSIGRSCGFDFGVSADSAAYCRSPVPASGDADFYGTTSSAGPWYVDMYAVSVGTDSGGLAYSAPHYCGSVTISKY